MKLMYCAYCHDTVELAPEPRSCECGKTSGHYLGDESTQTQDWPSPLVGIVGPDFLDPRPRTADALDAEIADHTE